MNEALRGDQTTVEVLEHTNKPYIHQASFEQLGDEKKEEKCTATRE